MRTPAAMEMTRCRGARCGFSASRMLSRYCGFTCAGRGTSLSASSREGPGVRALPPRLADTPAPLGYLASARSGLAAWVVGKGPRGRARPGR